MVTFRGLCLCFIVRNVAVGLPVVLCLKRRTMWWIVLLASQVFVSVCACWCTVACVCILLVSCVQLWRCVNVGMLSDPVSLLHILQITNHTFPILALVSVRAHFQLWYCFAQIVNPPTVCKADGQSVDWAGQPGL